MFDRAVLAPDVNDVEEWFQGTPFAGVFDGNGHTISHLTIEGYGYLGLFGQLKYGAIVKNLGMLDVNVRGTGDLVGALVGFGRGDVSECHSSGLVSSTGEGVGGLVGELLWSARVSRSSSSATVCGTQYPQRGFSWCRA